MNRDTKLLELTPEEYEKLSRSEAVLIILRVNEEGDVVSNYAELIGSREECELRAATMAGSLYVTPKGIRLEYEIVSASSILPPEEIVGEGRE